MVASLPPSCNQTCRFLSKNPLFPQDLFIQWYGMTMQIRCPSDFIKSLKFPIIRMIAGKSDKLEK